ncbi:MAG TPA: hypothetical protein VFC01_15410 [Mycobacterium sp.]|nr:hypothetical protein [Mycobacterium sp.]
MERGLASFTSYFDLKSGDQKASVGRDIPALKTIRPHRIPGTSPGDFPSKAWAANVASKMLGGEHGVKALAPSGATVVV